MKRTITILVAALVMMGFASCMDAAGNANDNPIAARGIHFRQTM